MTASAGGMFTSFTLQLNAAILALSINATSLAFGDVVVNTSSTQSVTLTSTGTVPVTINGATLTGAGFTLLGAGFPATLNPSQATTLNVEFDPTAVGTATGQLTITSNSSTNGTAVIGLSGTGTAAVAVAVTPTSVSTTVGATQQFAASVTGTSNTAVTWTASGTGCSGATCGTISSSGLYTAPAAVPSPATVTITATSASDPTKSASAAVIIVPPAGTTYYLAPAIAGGNDSNSGLSPSVPWLTPNHAVNCGDVIIAAVGAYTASNFDWTFGTVTCAAGNNVAWLECATPFACAITTSSTYAMDLTRGYWGVQGWVLSVTGGGAACVEINPNSNGEIHHIIFANNVMNGCMADGIATNNGTSTMGVDYLAYVGNIAYGAGGSSSNCSAGLSFESPIASDTLPGTHMYMGGNFAWGNTSNCGDGEGIIFDTFDGQEASPATAVPYAQQAVAENNLLIYNASAGLQVDMNENGSGPWAPIYFTHNTVAYNGVGPSTFTVCGEIVLSSTVTTQATANLVDAPSQYCYGGSSITRYGDLVDGVSTSTVQVYGEFAYSAYGIGIGVNGSPDFTAGPNNVTGTNPVFANPVEPGAPNCSGYATTTACMATVIANFTPTNAAAKAYGYQIPSSTSVYDPLFPQWLCNVNLPSGLVTMGCLNASVMGTGTGVKTQ
jgi:hypothetical protein